MFELKKKSDVYHQKCMNMNIAKAEIEQDSTSIEINNLNERNENKPSIYFEHIKIVMIKRR